MRCLRCVTDMQAMYPKSPHVSGRTAHCPTSESRAPLAARPAEHASLPHSNASMKPARVEAKKPTLDTRSFMTGPTLNATLTELLPSALYLISYLNEAKRRPRIAHLRRPLSPPSPFCPVFQWLTKSSYPASKMAGWPAKPVGYELCSSLIHLPPLA